MQTHELMTLSVQTMLRFAQPVRDLGNNWTVQFHYDLRGRNNLVRNAIIQSIDEYEDSALMYQLRALTGTGVELSKTLLYLDFQGVFSGGRPDVTPKKEQLSELSDDQKLRILFRDGMTIIFEDGIQRSFVPFDKSASMARQSRMTFLQRELKEEMDRRLMLDIPHSAIRTNLSKLYAYRGLYLTAARRMQLDDTFAMNGETVIVIDDKDVLIPDQPVQTATASEDQPDVWALSAPQRRAVRINAFDGEGLICPEYAKKLNRQLRQHYGFTRKASSFQIRMPFAKGVLHEVDFHGFAKELTHGDDLTVTDIFGRKRSLKKAKLILTKSMFKCHKWLSAYVGDADPMAYYFEKFRKYDHSLYIGNTDANLSDTGRVKLNYQFLNTLQLSGGDFETLLAQQGHALQQARNDFGKLRELLLPQGDAQGEDALLDIDAPAWALALAKNRAFLNDPKITGMLSGIENSMLRDCGLGRVDVEGASRFISRDLLSLLIHLLECCEETDAASLAEVKKQCLRPDKFYLPSPAIRLDPRKFYGLLRNPHLSRNEQTALKPYVPKKDEENLYTKYLSHLRGVVMVAYKSLVPMALSGCDFDGDLVKIVSDPLIVQAILDGVYGGDGSQRQLPILDIPAIGSRDTVAPASVDYETVQNTFSNHIGYISNLAIKFGKKEYSKGADREKFAGKCAECTILTGLEIDAAKTGRHPDLSPMEALEEDGEDYFLELKDKIARLSLKRGLVFEQVNKPEGNEILVSYKNANQPYMRVREIAPHEEAANLDRLPYQFVKLLREKQTRKTVKTPSENRLFFRFQEEEGWEEGLEQEKLQQLSGIIGSYQRLQRLSFRVYQAQEKYKDSKYAACIYHILNVRYDGLDAPVLPEISVRDALSSAYALVDAAISSYEVAKQLLCRIVDEAWQFTPPGARKNTLAALLGVETDVVSEEAEALLCDFRCAGYKLLYYIAKDVWCQSGDAFAQSMMDEDESAADPELYARMRALYRAAMQNKESKKLWSRRLVALCRRAMGELFGGDFDEALRYAHALRSSADRSGTFFWSVFKTDEILRCVRSDMELGGERNAQ